MVNRAFHSSDLWPIEVRLHPSTCITGNSLMGVSFNDLRRLSDQFIVIPSTRSPPSSTDLQMTVSPSQTLPNSEVSKGTKFLAWSQNCDFSLFTHLFYAIVVILACLKRNENKLGHYFPWFLFSLIKTGIILIKIYITWFFFDCLVQSGKSAKWRGFRTPKQRGIEEKLINRLSLTSSICIHWPAIFWNLSCDYLVI